MTVWGLSNHVLADYSERDMFNDIINNGMNSSMDVFVGVLKNFKA